MTTTIAIESAHGTLVANAPTLVLTTTLDHTRLECWNTGTVPIFGRLDGKDATVGDAGCFMVPAGNSVPVVLPLPIGSSGIAVNLISASTGSYSVVCLDR
jgi:hypothetical protein